MKKRINEYIELISKKRKIIFVLIVMIIFIPVILYWMLITPSKIGFIRSSNVGDFIGYYGAVLGGGLTLWGVRLSIDYQKEANRKEKAIQFKPILEFTDISKPEQVIPTREVSLGVPGYSINTGQNKNDTEGPHYFYINQKQSVKFNILITNNGRGETANAVLKSFMPVHEQIKWTNKNDLYFATNINQNIGEIISGQSLGITTKLPIYLLIKKELYREGDILQLPTILELRYSDMFQEITYEYLLHIRFDVKLTKEHEKVDGELYAVKVNYALSQIMPVRKILNT